VSFRNRLALLLGVFVSVLVTVTSLAIYRVVDRSLHSQVDSFLQDRVSSVSARLESSRDELFFGGRRFRDPLGEALLDTRFDVMSQVIDKSGRAVYTIGEFELPITDADVAIARGGAPKFRDVELFGVSHRMYVVPIRGGGALQLGREIEETAKSLSRIRGWLIGIGTALVVLAILVSSVLARLVTAPLRRLSSAANEVATTGSLDVTIRESGAAEVQSLATSLNTMLQRIRQSFDRERQFVQDASHELRTPLTSLRVNTELLERPEIEDDERAKILADIRSEVDALTAISTELATLAVDQRTIEEPMDVDLADITEVVVDRVRRRSNRNIRFTHTDKSSNRRIVSVRLSQFERALANLLDNAVKFSPETSDIEVNIEGEAVEVVDHGPGIDDSEKERIFTRFYRSPSTRALPGSGLGLAIVRQFADDHGAKIRVIDTPGGGATFQLRF
jgi:two-component system, OmpR family, sensor histidine kinase MprB